MLFFDGLRFNLQEIRGEGDRVKQKVVDLLNDYESEILTLALLMGYPPISRRNSVSRIYPR